MPVSRPAWRLSLCPKPHLFTLATGLPAIRSCGAADIAVLPANCHKTAMCYCITTSGEVVPVWSRTNYDEVMLHCARIGFNP